MKSFGKTDKGIVRDRNEDAIFLNSASFGNLSNIFIVADGMGGHNAGDFASFLSIKMFCDYIYGSKDILLNSEKKYLDFLDLAVRDANLRLYDMSNTNELLSGMGTTFTMCTICENNLYIAHVGDSRVYIYNNKLKQITIDHSYVNQLLNLGQITKEEAAKHTKKNFLTRALGPEQRVEVDTFHVKLNVGDVILICTDGLHNYVSSDEISKILDKEITINEKVDKLIDKANFNGGKDNVSVILIEV